MKSFLVLLLFSVFNVYANQPEHDLPARTITYEKIEQLPKRLLQIHQISILENQCKDNLEEQLLSEKAFSWTLDFYTKFYALPCARWGDNQSWKIYVEHNEPRSDGFGLFKQLLFPKFDWKKQLVATDVIHNWIWSENNQTLRSLFLYNGREDCGAQYNYEWDNGTFQFKMKSVRFKAVCDGQTNWPEIPIP